MRENCNFVVPISILTLFVLTLFSWAARHTTVCLDNVKVLESLIKSGADVNAVNKVSY